MWGEVEKRFANTSADEFASMLLGERADLFDAVFCEFVGAFDSVISTPDFVYAKVDRVVGVVDGDTNFDVWLVVKHTSRNANVKFLRQGSLLASGVEEKLRRWGRGGGSVQTPGMVPRRWGLASRRQSHSAQWNDDAGGRLWRQTWKQPSQFPFLA